MECHSAIKSDKLSIHATVRWILGYYGVGKEVNIKTMYESIYTAVQNDKIMKTDDCC